MAGVFCSGMSEGLKYLDKNSKAEFFYWCRSRIGHMREEGVQPPAVASDPALRRPLEAPAAKRCGLRVFPPAPPSLRGCQGTNQAAQLRLPGRVTEGKGGSGALSPAVKIIAEQWGGQEANAANYVHLSLCESRQERSSSRSRQDARARTGIK